MERTYPTVGTLVEVSSTSLESTKAPKSSSSIVGLPAVLVISKRGAGAPRSRATWLVVVLAFVGLLGGTHPSDATRDVVLRVAAAVIVALNVPVVVQLVRRREPRDARALTFTWAGLVLRLGISASVLAFVGSISHEKRLDREAPDSWSSHDAWRRCRRAIAAWPREPAPGCPVLHMCANEAPLAADEQTRLAEMIDATPGCAPP